MLTRLLLALSVMTVSTSLATADTTNDSRQLTSIDFTIGGVGIGSSLKDFHHNLPTAVAGHAPNNIPMQDDHLVVINNGVSQAPIAYFRFLEGKVATIEVHYTAMGIDEISVDKPMIEQLTDRFGPDETPRRSNVLGAAQYYWWKSNTRVVFFSVGDDGNAKLFISSNPTPVTYPPQTPKTNILGIDPKPVVRNGG
ncbi:hypothetical protein [Neorhodopirellula lusitana]|uniref:hypothetical protein n=1 Tax=Neorhodopirellula lusitana TaxID=445327 RepID=UPI0038512C63